MRIFEGAQFAQFSRSEARRVFVRHSILLIEMRLAAFPAVAESLDGSRRSADWE
jgi:hypothetical protein